MSNRKRNSKLTEINETYEDLLNNPTRALQVFNTHSNEKGRIFLRNEDANQTIAFSCPKNKKRIKFWVVGGVRTRRNS